MDKTTVWFIKASMVYFLVGSIIGFIMTVWPEGVVHYRSVHAHLNLLGWMSMMIYGVGYHILPRFSGRPLYSLSIARAQFWLANIGLIGMISTWPLVTRDIALGISKTLLAIFSLTEALAVFLFIYNIWKTMKTAGQ
jgi:cbb3-type cytochrome oxidase subunit 1